MSETEQTSQSDDNTLRGSEFRTLLLRPLTLLTLLGLAALGAVLGRAGSPALAVAPLVVGLVVVWFMADQRSQDSFFISFAQSHGMKRIADKELPEATPLLRHAGQRRTVEYLEGPLDENTEGVLALYEYTVNSQDIVVDDRTHSETFPFTLILVQMPETRDVFGDIYVQEQVTFEAVQGAKEVHKEGFERVKLESRAMDDKYEILVKGADPVAVRQLFSPVFIEWMVAVTEQGFAFDLEQGVLCVYATGHRGTVPAVDNFRTASLEVVKRIREEMAAKA